MTTNLLTKFKALVSVFLVLVLALTFVSGTEVSAQVKPAPTVIPQAAMDSAANPIFALDMTACLEVFNWRKYIDDLNAGITNSNPYDSKDCVRQENLARNGTRTVTRDASGNVTEVRYNVGNTQITRNRYADFTIGQASTKQEFGNLPVLGVFPNSGLPAQALNAFDVDGTARGTTPTVDRSQLANLGSTFTADQLNQIYSTGTARTGMPRIPYTGPNGFSGQVWTGGFCTTQNGRLVTKTIGPDSAGNTWTVADYGENPASPITTCRWPDSQETRTSTPVLFDPEGLVKDQNLAVYQFIYKIPFPSSAQECNSLFPNVFSNYDQCIGWFRERYSRALTGQATGNAIYYTYTFYGSFDDRYTQWVGWHNPDINKVRANFTSQATLAQLRTYFQDPEDVLRSLFNDQTSTRAALITRMNNSSQAIQNQYLAVLKERYESYIRGSDGYSIYAF